MGGQGSWHCMSVMMTTQLRMLIGMGSRRFTKRWWCGVIWQLQYYECSCTAICRDGETERGMQRIHADDEHPPLSGAPHWPPHF